MLFLHPEAAAASQYVHPGQVQTAAAATILHTVLGSCVSVCLWDAEAGVGGMNHFVLPSAVDATPSLRYAAPALEELVSRLRGLGARRLEAKLFGGARMFAGAAGTSVGEQNVTEARRLLAARNIPLLTEDVGGRAGRKVLFGTSDGSAWVRLLGGGAV